MIAKVPVNVAARVERTEPARASEPSPAIVLSVFWRRRWFVLTPIVLGAIASVVYLHFARPLYTSSAILHVASISPRIMSTDGEVVATSDNFLYTEAEVVKSERVLSAAIDKLDWRHFVTFAGSTDPVGTLATSKLMVEVGKHEDVLIISMESPSPRESADIVNAVVAGYLAEATHQKRATADEILKILGKEQEDRAAELKAMTREMHDFQDKNSATIFENGAGNLMASRVGKLLDLLNTADLDVVNAAAEWDVARSVMDDPVSVHAYVESMRTKSPNSFREIDTLRDHLEERRLSHVGMGILQGEKSRISNIIKAETEALQAQVAGEEQRLFQQFRQQASDAWMMARARMKHLRESVDAQQKEASNDNMTIAEAARLKEGVDRIEKQADALEQRMEEVKVEQNGATLNVQTLQSAHPGFKSKPRGALILAYGLIGGLFAGSFLALWREWVDQRIRTSVEVERTMGLTILGRVPHMSRRMLAWQRSQEAHLAPRSPVAEAARTIRTAMRFGNVPDWKTLVVTSARPSDGKSTVASNLAIALAQAGERTLLLDADFRQPVQHKNFRLSVDKGVSTVVSGEHKLRDAIASTDIRNLSILPCGPIPDHPSEMIAGRRFAQIMERLSTRFDRIVIDSPPVMSVSDGLILAASADVTLLVVRINGTPRQPASHAVEGLRSVGAKVLGAVVNDSNLGDDIRYHYPYGNLGAQIRQHRDLSEDAPNRWFDLSGGGRELSEDALLLEFASAPAPPVTEVR